ncbi:GNAT domain protein [Vibrio phage 1.015.O._10N.222.51.E5]|nr:GNAT domain protein [Vibrio phage 1.015.O._10N.222.51.E5]
MSNTKVERVLLEDLRRFQPMLEDHYKEVPLANEVAPMDIDWHTYSLLEGAGHLLILVAIDDGFIVGYLVAISSPCLHHEGKMESRTDSFFVHPEHRGNGVFQLLLEEYNLHCKSGGVDHVYISSNKTFPVAGDILEKLGYVESETAYRLKE